MKILNLYSGIGGNRKFWGNDHQITAIESNEDIADIYKQFFPNDEVIVADAHEYLLKNHKNFDFIWNSPPCPSHSRIRNIGVKGNRYDEVYPDMKLYEEIILLQHHARKEVKWVVENVIPYYKPLIIGKNLHRHMFWSNFFIRDYHITDNRKHRDIKGDSTVYGISLKEFDVKNKRKILRNMVNPDLGLHVFKESLQLPYN